MAWCLFAAAAWTAALLAVPVRQWKKHWKMGVAGMIVVFVIDTPLIQLDAFQYSHTGRMVSGLPLPYWLSFFPGGMIFDRLRPMRSHWGRAAFIAGCAVFLLVLEILMIRLGGFRHIRWNILKALFLNLGGFTNLMWIAEWLSPQET